MSTNEKPSGERPEGRFEDRDDVRDTVFVSLIINGANPFAYDIEVITDELYQFAGGESWEAVWDVPGDDFARIVQSHKIGVAA